MAASTVCRDLPELILLPGELPLVYVHTAPRAILRHSGWGLLERYLKKGIQASK
jgi:hypothetical protein